MPKKPHPLGFVFQNGQVSGSLKIGVMLEDVLQKDFVLREATVDDLLDAENEADVTKPLNFSAQLMVRQLIRIGTFEGPFTLNMIRRMKPADWRILRAAQMEIDDQGEDGPASGATS